MRAFLSRLVDVVFRGSRDKRLSEEVQAHLDLLIDDFIASGLSPDEAQLAARKAFGGVEQVKHVYRDQRGFRPLDEFMQDLRYALRLIARDRWFTAANVTTLALGIGVCSTMIALIYSMNFRGLPFDSPHEIVAVGGEPTPGLGSQLPFQVFDALRQSTGSFSALSAEVDAPVNLGDAEHGTEQFAGTFVNPGTFAVLRVQPTVGRVFHADDDRSGAPAVIIIGYRLWTDRYGADPNVVGRTVRVNSQPATVIGVMPEGFTYPIDQQVWRPLSALPGMDAPTAGRRGVRIIGRLAEGVSVEGARARLAAMVTAFDALPEADRKRRTIVTPLNETYFGKPTQPVPMMMLAAVLVVLLIACSHAASLQLARAAARAREMCMRAALGAGRGRMVRQLLVESVVTALLAGVLGIGIALIFVRMFANEVTSFGMPYWTRFTFDFPLIAVIVVLCVATGVAFGLLPALHASRANLTDVLNQGGRSGSSPRAQRTTNVLLIGELALTMILLSSASGFVRSADIVYRADHSLDLSRLWEFRIALPARGYASVDERRAFARALDERLAAAPGMESAALATAAPFNARDSRAIFTNGDVPVDRRGAPTASFVPIGERYFETLGLRVMRGQRFADLEPGARAAAALVNERFVERFSPDADPIGRELFLVNERAPDAPPQRVRIVGIAPPLRQEVSSGHTPVVYVPYDTYPGAIVSLIIRGRPEQFAEALRQEVRRIDPDLPLFNLQSLESVSYKSRWIQRITSTGFSVVAIISTLLSAFGLYSLTAYAAAQRTQEIGVRMALGAQRLQVSWLFLQRTLRTVAIGLAIGLGGAVALGNVLQGAMVDVRANHPLALAGIAALLAAVTLAASVIPARRASRLDPVAALRQD